MESKFAIMVMMFIMFLAAVATGSDSGGGSSRPSPILFIPGLTASPLDVQDSSNSNCNTNNQTLNIWVNSTLIAASPECFTSQLRLNYSAGYSNSYGVSITVPGFGSFSPFIEFYFSEFLDYFEDRGYTRNDDIRSAPYDWRLSPEQLNDNGYYVNLKELIQTMYEENGNTKVTIVIHSMGGPVSLYFLTRIVNQEWKDMYVHSYVTLAGAWSGGNAIIQNLLSGPGNETIERIVGSLELRSLYRTFPSSYLLLARPSVWNDTVLVSTPTRNYTANDLQELFTDAGYPQGYTQFSEIPMEYPAPNVSTYCFYGLGVDTPMSLIYESQASFPDSQPKIINGDGDNSVNKPSSEVCLRWANSAYRFNRTVFPNVDHSEILSNAAVLRAIANIVGAPEDPSSGSFPLSTLKPQHFALMFLFMSVFIIY